MSGVRFPSDLMETKKRNEMILPIDIDKIYKVHTGKEYKEIKITSNKVGKLFGEFAITKTPAIWKKHGKKH